MDASGSCTVEGPVGYGNGGSGGNGDGGSNGGSQQPPDDPEFENLPIDPAEIDGVQWFGGTFNAYQLQSFSNVYQYCHYFHCGLDIIAPWGTPVSAGVYGQVIYADCNSGNHEGPCKVQIGIGEYVITYGHLSGMPLVTRGDTVYPDTLLGGVGSNSKDSNNPDFPDPNLNFTHIHLEVRGPGGWSGGPSVNPLLFMSNSDVAVLVDIASNQTVESQMGVFYDGTAAHPYPPPAYLMPDKIWRTTENDTYFP